MSPPRTTSSGWRLAALLLTLAGLFAMHGLADHGMTDDADAQAMSAMLVAPHADVVTAPSGTGSHGTMDMDGAGMCVAVLLLVAVGAVVLARAGRPRRTDVVLPRRARAPARRGRAPDPPTPVALSVRRC